MGVDTPNARGGQIPIIFLSTKLVKMPLPPKVSLFRRSTRGAGAYLSRANFGLRPWRNETSDTTPKTTPYMGRWGHPCMGYPTDPFMGHLDDP